MKYLCPQSLSLALTQVLGTAASAHAHSEHPAASAMVFDDPTPVAAPEGSLTAWRGRLSVASWPRAVDAGRPVSVALSLPLTEPLSATIERTVAGGDAVAGAIWHPTLGEIEIRPSGETSRAGGRESLVLVVDPGAVVHCNAEPRFGPAEHGIHDATDAVNTDIASVGVSDRGEPASSACGCGDDGSVIDIMVVYTPPARVAAGGTAAIQAVALASVASLNTSFANSGLADTQVRLVHMHETDFRETQDLPSGRFREALSRQGDGFMDEVGPLRDQYAADLVALLIHDFGIPGLAGNAFLSPGGADRGVSVTRQASAIGSLVFAHEVGHNFGCQHDIDAYDTLPDQSYALGHKFTPAGFGLQKTVMAYFPGAAIPQFSNPDVLVGGVPTGLNENGSDRRHNVRVIRETRRSIANFRQSSEAFADCNRNGVDDRTDIAGGSSLDLNTNGMPDECETRLYVDASAPAGGDGRSWATAFNDLTDATGTPRYLCDAVTEVWVAGGTYRASGPNDSKWDRFFVGPHLRLLGGFAGDETHADQRNPAVNTTVLSGDRLGDDPPGWVNMAENSINVWGCWIWPRLRSPNKS